ncbi:MAG: glycosyltransferase family 4 protein [Cyclobacteriaceae bacterium]
MKVLFLNFEKGWRGGERQTLYALQGFKDAGSSAEVVCRKGSALEKEAIEGGFKAHSFSSIFGVIFFLITKGSRFDFMLPQTSQILTYCVLTKFFHRSKIFFARRVNFSQRGFFTKLKYQLTDKIIAVSNPVKETLTRFTKRNDIEVIPDVVVEKQINHNRAKEVLAKLKIGNHKIVATTAALTSEKDPFTLVDAIKKLSEKRNDFVFIHFGSGNLLESVSEKIKENNLQDLYVLMGFVNDVEDFFAVFNVFVFNSREEGLGSSVLDAFIYKVPVVSTDAGGLKDLVSEDRGIQCPIGDSSALAEGISELLSNEKKAKLYIANAFNYVNQFHSSNHVTNQYIKLMNQMTKVS